MNCSRTDSSLASCGGHKGFFGGGDAAVNLEVARGARLPAEVAAHAIAWLQSILSLPSSPMLATRAIARADIVAALAAFGDRELNAFLEQWDTPDTQAALQAVMARLKK